MHEKVLPKRTLALLTKLESLKRHELDGWTLAGGTGLALQIGHRRSEDLDFLKSLGYFADAEDEPMPRMLVPFNWKECRAFFIREARSLLLP